MKKRNAISERYRAFTRQEKWLLPIFHAVMLVFAIWAMLPILFAVLNSFKNVDEYYTSSMALPTYVEWSNYANAFSLTYRNANILKMFFNSVVFVATFLFGNMASSVMTAYVLSKYRFFGRNFLYALAITTQLIPIFGSQGAGYILCSELGLVDNIWLLWISGASGFNYTFLIVYSYFQNVDSSYSESAFIDGAGNFTVFIRIMVPMVMPSILIMGLSTFVSLWNDYATALIFLPNNPVLATGIYNLQTLSAYIQGGATTYFAAVVIALIPVLIVFVSAQKYIFSINLEGGIKG